MKLREYAAIMTGALTFIAAAAAQWLWTQRPVEDVIYIALMIALVAGSAFVIATEPQRKQPRRKHRAKTIEREPSRPVFITLDRKEWEA
ncbi:MAG: hypothetical protein LIO94_07890 [Clostridiales bacterium]|nr:hypothetical protein [Clostridiales bacterium]